MDDLLVARSNRIDCQSGSIRQARAARDAGDIALETWGTGDLSIAGTLDGTGGDATAGDGGSGGLFFDQASGDWE